ncbi:hypothetical protein GGR56DRAFT_640504 [Xylariaceae sp. FL0804]|nr:hypothetical protein GGR56DRAFT_640504 [Xylariaceae sp. FL0804]
MKTYKARYIYCRMSDSIAVCYTRGLYWVSFRDISYAATVNHDNHRQSRPPPIQSHFETPRITPGRKEAHHVRPNKRGPGVRRLGSHGGSAPPNSGHVREPRLGGGARRDGRRPHPRLLAGPRIRQRGAGGPPPARLDRPGLEAAPGAGGRGAHRVPARGPALAVGAAGHRQRRLAPGPPLRRGLLRLHLRRAGPDRLRLRVRRAADARRRAVAAAAAAAAGPACDTTG